MANTLTNLIPDVYQAMDTVSRELVGFIPAVSLDAEADRAAVGQNVRTHVAPAAAAEDVTPGSVPPDTGDQTIGSAYLTISKARAVPFRWTGEEQRGVNSGVGYANIRADQIAQAIRTLCNEIEADVAALYAKTSRAYGTAGTTPFGTANDLSDFAQPRKILEDNGAPGSDLHMVLGTTAMANLRSKQSGLFNVNAAGTDELLRRGMVSQVEGLGIHSSAQVKAHTKGTGASATTNNAGYAVGATEITLASAGTGTILAGDVITFAGDTNKYLVVSGDADVSGGGTITLAAPGLRVAIATSATNITVGNSYAGNMVFHRNAIVLATRAPALPEEGDSADDRMLVTDPVSGMTLELAMYKQYRRVRYEIAAAWGCQMIKPEHSAILLG